MNPIIHMITRMFTRRFYAQNTGFFLFIFVLMVGVIQTLDSDTGMVWLYHHKLILGMLGNNSVFCLVLFLWLLYAFKCSQFVTNILSAPDTVFLDPLNTLAGRRLFILFFGLQVSLIFPVLTYSVIIIVIALSLHLYVKALIIILFHLIVCIGSALWRRQKLRYRGVYTGFIIPRININLPRPYFSFLLSYLLRDLTFLFLATKIFSCFLLSVYLINLEQGDYDLRMMMLIYTMTLIGHAVFIHKIRQLEETRLVFYRQLPVTRWKRWMQYVLLYCIVIIPEMVVIARFTPLPLHVMDAIYIVLYTLALLLLLHAILASVLMPLKQFLKITLAIFFILYFFILARSFIPMISLLFIAATFIFVSRYYRFELRQNIPG